MRTLTALAASGLISLVAVEASAAPADDFAAGTNLFVRRAVVVVNGSPYSVSNLLLPKTSGTLEVDLDLRSLGASFDQVVTLVGSSSGDVLTWTLPHQTLSPPIDMGGGVSITEVEGRLDTHAAFTPGDMPQTCGDDPCDYDVTADGLASSYLHVWGSAPFPIGGFDSEVQLSAGQLSGGLPRATLAAMTVSGPHLCSSASSRALAGEVVLGTPARSGGADVDLSTTLAGLAGAMPSVHVRGGATRAPFSVPIPAGFAGLFRVTASAGGSTRSQDIDVLPEIDCQTGPAGPTYAVRPLMPSRLIQLLDQCAACVTSGLLNSRGDAVVETTQGAYFANDEAGLVALHDVIKDYDLSSLRLNDLGQLAGTAVDQHGTAHGFLLSSLATPEAMQVTFLDGETPSWINGLGAVGGALAKGTGLFDSYSLRALDTALASPTAIGADDIGRVFFTVLSGKSTSTYAYDFTKSSPIAGLGGDVVATHVHAFGDAVGGARDTKGIEHAFWLPRGQPGVKDLGILSGYVSSRATGINASGWIVGNATGAKGEAATFVYAPGSGMQNLQKLVDPKSGLVVTAALGITDVGEILVRGQVNGVSGFYVLSAS